MPKPKRWEIDQGDWKRILEAVHREMISIARGGQTISYSDLVGRVGYFAGPDSHALTEMLGEINAAEPRYKAEPLLISAVVTHKDDKYPGVGFFSAAAYLGKAVPMGDAEQQFFWASELALVHEAYGRRGDR